MGVDVQGEAGRGVAQQIVSGVQPGTRTVCFDGRYADYPPGGPGGLELAYAARQRLSEKQECLIADYNALQTARRRAAVC